MSWSLTVAGVDVLDYVYDQSLSIKATAYSQSGIMSFILVGAPGDFSVTEEDEVIWSDGVTTHYAGFVRQLKRATEVKPGKVRYSIDCQDYSTLLKDDVIYVDANRTTDETDAERIAWLFESFGTKGITVGAEVQTLTASMPTQDFTAKTLQAALEMVLSLSAGKWYVDTGKALHTYLAETATAPHGLSDSPTGTTGVTGGTFGYRDLILPVDTTGLVNAVYAIPSTSTTGAAPTWYTDDASIAMYGQRSAIVTGSQVLLQSTLDAMGAAYLADNGPKRTATLTTFEPGLRAGQVVELTSADYALSAEPLRIVTIETTFPTSDGPEYRLEMGDPKPSLWRTFVDIVVNPPPVSGGGGFMELPPTGWHISTADYTTNVDGVEFVVVPNDSLTDLGGGAVQLEWAGGGEGPWWTGSTVTVTGVSGDMLAVWADDKEPTVEGDATVSLVSSWAGVWLVTWTADGEIVISPGT